MSRARASLLATVLDRRRTVCSFTPQDVARAPWKRASAERFWETVAIWLHRGYGVAIERNVGAWMTGTGT